MRLNFSRARQDKDAEFHVDDMHGCGPAHGVTRVMEMLSERVTSKESEKQVGGVLVYSPLRSNAAKLDDWSKRCPRYLAGADSDMGDENTDR